MCETSLQSILNWNLICHLQVIHSLTTTACLFPLKTDSRILATIIVQWLTKELGGTTAVTIATSMGYTGLGLTPLLPMVWTGILAKGTSIPTNAQKWNSGHGNSQHWWETPISSIAFEAVCLFPVRIRQCKVDILQIFCTNSASNTGKPLRPT